MSVADETTTAFTRAFRCERTGILLQRFLLVLACAWVCACAERESVPDTATAVAAEDVTGRVVQLPAPAQRIVSLMPTVTDLLLAMRVQDRLIARTDYDTDTAVAHLPSLGGGLTPSIEWLTAEKPDLVISWPDQGARALVKQLMRVDIPVYSARSESIQDTYDILADLGVLLGLESTADSLSRAIRTALDSVQNAVRDRERVNVVYVVGLEPTTVAAGGTFIDELITIAGGRNIFAQLRLWPQVNLEEVIQRDPDVIVLADTNLEDPVTLLRGLPGWRELRAVKAGRVYRVSPWFFNRSGPTMTSAARELARFFHGQ